MYIINIKNFLIYIKKACLFFSANKPVRPNSAKLLYLSSQCLNDISTILKPAKNEMHSNKLIVKPGILVINKLAIEAYTEGVYRLTQEDGKTYQFIVFRNDLQQLLYSIGALFIHSGGKYNRLSTSQLLQLASTQLLEVTCGTATRVSEVLLSQVGIRARQVSFFTLEKWNSYDNGHTLLEIWDSNWDKWRLIDFDLKCEYFAEDKETPIGIVELVESSSFHLKFFGPRQLTGHRGQGVDSTFLFQGIFFDNSLAIQWIKQKAQFAVLHFKGKYTSYIQDDQQLKEAHHLLPSYSFVSKDKFMEYYHSGEKL